MCTPRDLETEEDAQVTAGAIGVVDAAMEPMAGIEPATC